MAWEIRKLGDVCEFQNGFGFKSNLYKPGGLPIVRITNIQNEKIESKDVVYFHLNDYTEDFTRYKVSEGDLVIAMSGATTGKIGINCTTTVFYLNQRVGKFTPSKALSKDYLYYYLSTQVEESLKISAGAAQPNLSTEQIKNFEIPIPPLAEQKRIVAILDEAFSAIASAKENAEKNLKNAKELFESYLNNIFEKKGKDWEKKNLGEVCSLITKGSSPKWQGVSYVNEPGILFVTSENIGEFKLIIDHKKFVEEKFNLKDKKSILKKGDVLTNIVGASIGRTAIYTLDDLANINQAVCILRCKNELLLNVYLMYLLNSPFLRKILHSNEVNTARANLSLSFFSNLVIPLPPLKEQQRIVAKLDALSEQTKKLEAVYAKKIADLDELKKSILQKAFRGEL